MSKRDWIKDQLLEVKRDLESWSESRRNVMRREVGSADNNNISTKRVTARAPDDAKPTKAAR